MFVEGKYRFVEKSFVREAAAISSKVVRKIDEGGVVNIISVKDEDGRVEGELEDGNFVTLFDKAENKEYATKIEEPSSSVSYYK